MIHKILLWVCGIASILGILFYILDKTSQKDFSFKLTISLIVGGIIGAVILALTEPKNTSNPQAPKQDITIKENKNSPITNTVQTQNNYYYDSPDENESDQKGQPDELNESSINSLEVPKIVITKSNYEIFTNQKPIRLNILPFDIKNSKKKKRNFERLFESYLTKVIKENSLPIILEKEPLKDALVISGWADDIDAEVKISNAIIISNSNKQDNLFLNSISRNVETESSWNLYIKDYSLKDLTFLVYNICGQIVLNDLPEQVNFKFFGERKGIDHPVDIQHLNLTNGIKLLELSLKSLNQNNLRDKFKKQEIKICDNLGLAYKKYAVNSKWFQMESGKEYEGKKDGVHQFTLKLDSEPIKNAYHKANHFYWTKYILDEEIPSATFSFFIGEEYLNTLLSFKDKSFFQQRDIYCENILKVFALEKYNCRYFKDLLYAYRKFKCIGSDFKYHAVEAAEVDYILRNIQEEIYGKPAYGYFKECYKRSKYLFEELKNYPLKIEGNKVRFKNIYDNSISGIRVNTTINFLESNLKEIEVNVKPNEIIEIDIKLSDTQTPRDIILNAIKFSGTNNFVNPPIIKE